MTDILLFQNAPAPYRTPWFKQLQEYHDLKIIYNTMSKVDRVWSLEGLNQHRYIDLEGRCISLFGKHATLCSPWHLWKVLNKESPKVIIIIDDMRCLYTNMLVCLYAKWNRVPIVLWCSELLTEYRPQMLPRGMVSFLTQVRSFYARQAIAFMAYGSRHLATYLSNTKHRYISMCGTQSVELLQRRAPIRKEKTCIRFCYLGFFRPEKGIKYLLEAFKGLESEDLKLSSELHLVGNGPLLDEYQKNYQSKRISFHGFTEGKKKQELLESCDVLVLPSLHDPWANVTIEAAFLKIPVIATESAGAAYDLVQPEKTGIVVETGNVESLKQSMKKLIENPSLIDAMGESIYELAIEQYSYDACTKRFGEFVQKLQVV